MSTYSFNLVIENVGPISPITFLHRDASRNLRKEFPMVPVNRKSSRYLASQTESGFRMRIFPDSYVLKVLLAKRELGTAGRWRGRMQVGARRH